MLDELEANVPFSDFAALEAAGTDAVLKDDRVMAAVLACVN
jgi:predicted FMN-binding regulatory protein PaiB